MPPAVYSSSRLRIKLPILFLASMKLSIDLRLLSSSSSDYSVIMRQEEEQESRSLILLKHGGVPNATRRNNKDTFLRGSSGENFTNWREPLQDLLGHLEEHGDLSALSSDERGGKALSRQNASSTTKGATIKVLSSVNATVNTTSLAVKDGKRGGMASLDQVESSAPPSPNKPSGNHSFSENGGRFACAYVIGGCKPEDPVYRNYFYNIMISTYLQRQENSTADVLVLVQMSYSSQYNELPLDDIVMLHKMGIKIEYIPKAHDESFYRTMLDKFLVLGLTQYDRVLFMDGDIIVHGNLDYLFELSMSGLLQPNVVFAGYGEPANGGFFIVAPGEGKWERVIQIIQEKEERGAKLPRPHWDKIVGWGHAFAEGDYYETLSGEKNNTWNFYGAFADQGLLYQWVKYEEKAVSIIRRFDIQNWGVNETGQLHLNETISLDVFDGHASKRPCFFRGMRGKPCKAPHRDYYHFTGWGKPWMVGPPGEFLADPKSEPDNNLHKWFQVLAILNEQLELGLDFHNWKTDQKPLLGMKPAKRSIPKTQYALTNIF